MQRMFCVACLVTSIMALTGYAAEKERIGVYDSRAIAVAFTGSEVFNQWMSGLNVEYQKAKAAGDQKRVAELKAEGMERQKLMHKQGFSTAPVGNILKHIKKQMLKIEKDASLKTIMSKWDTKALAQYKSAEQVDVTLQLMDAFKPNRRQKKNAIEIQKHKPITLNRAGNIKD